MLLNTLSSVEVAIQGLWFIHVPGSREKGAAVVFMNGKIQGGDVANIYEGEYTVGKDHAFRGKIQVRTVSPSSALFAWFCLLGPFDWQFEATIKRRHVIRGEIYRMEDSQVSLPIQFSKKAGLPPIAFVVGYN